MPDLEIMEGRRALSIDEVAHVMVPGAGRDDTGYWLSSSSVNRAEFAGVFYEDHFLESASAVIVCSGYKTPADMNGFEWSPEDAPDEVYLGVPEADSMRDLLIARGMARKAIRVERKSTDTVTNFTRTEAGYFFGDDRPVAIVAQEQHLERIMRVIAPRTLRRDYLGLIVPENGQVWTEGFARRALSRAILLGMNPYTPKLVEKTSRRSELVWKVVNGVRRPEPSEVYRTLDAPEATDSQA